MVIRAPPRQSLDNDTTSWSSSQTYTDPLSSPFLANHEFLNDASSPLFTAIDFRETAPQASTPEMFVHAPPGSSQVGGLAVAVPGEVRGLYTAYEMYGSGQIEWKDLVLPVAELAKGWRVGRELARRFRVFGCESPPPRSYVR